MLGFERVHGEFRVCPANEWPQTKVEGEEDTKHSKDSEVTTNWRDQGRLLGGGGTCDEPPSTEMGLPDQGEEARLHGIRWLECGGDSGAVSGASMC